MNLSVLVQFYLLFKLFPIQIWRNLQSLEISYLQNDLKWNYLPPLISVNIFSIHILLFTYNACSQDTWKHMYLLPYEGGITYTIIYLFYSKVNFGQCFVMEE